MYWVRDTTSGLCSSLGAPNRGNMCLYTSLRLADITHADSAIKSLAPQRSQHVPLRSSDCRAGAGP